MDETLAILVDLEQQEATAESAQAAKRSLTGYKGHVLVHWNQSTATKFFCTVLTKSISRVDSSNRFDTLEKEALRSKRGAESVAT